MERDHKQSQSLVYMVDDGFVKRFIWNDGDICNSSARAIRKTALRAYCGYRHCFTHLQALSS